MASEASKIIITNLFVINAGGLVALPSLSGFLTDRTLSHELRWQAAVPPAGLFIAGLILAGVCAWLTYFNFVANAKTAEERGFEEVTGKYLRTDVFRESPLTPERQKAVEAKEQQHKADAEGYLKTTRWTFLAAHAAGILSIICFIAACLYLGFWVPLLGSGPLANSH
jgi:hypothetical protein